MVLHPLETKLLARLVSITQSKENSHLQRMFHAKAFDRNGEYTWIGRDIFIKYGFGLVDCIGAVEIEKERECVWMSMAKERKESKQSQNKPWFMGWDNPILPAACERLFEEYHPSDQAGNAQWDMRDVVIVLPSSFAQWRLNELLAIRAREAGCALYPPTIVTLGVLPEQLYVAKYPFASDVVQALAWTAALRQTEVEDLRVLVPNPPDRDAMQPWLELARVLAKLHVELASDRLDFSKVADALGKNHVETPRWRTLAKVQRLYLDELSRRGLWDIQSARLVALEKAEPATTRTIIVIGCVDLNRTQRGFLSAVAGRARIWVAAPESVRDGFDPLGCLESEWWQSQLVDIPAEALMVGNSPSDQAELVASSLAELPSDMHVRDVTLGVPDETIIPELQRRLSQSDVSTRFGAGLPLSKSEPVRLLESIGQYLTERSFAALATLVRHPAVDSVLRRRAESNRDAIHRALPLNWLARLDEYYEEAMPSRVGDYVNDDLENAATYRAIVEAIDDWLKPLAGEKNQPISKWAEPLRRVLTAAYGKAMCDWNDPLDEKLYRAAVLTSEAIDSLDDIPGDLQPKLGVHDCIHWLIDNLSGQLVPEPSNLSAVEIRGWLDLPWDDAPVLVIAGLHDGVVPGSVNADMFLPNQMRRQMGMMDNARRFARDLYSMKFMLASREHVRIIVGKADARGNPLVPCRLLLACDLAELPARVLHLIQEDRQDVLPEVERRRSKPQAISELIIPQPEVVEAPSRISVTAFRDYLACPYRFYLRHILKLRSKSDDADELPANRFGDLVHRAVDRLGESPVSQSTDMDSVRDFLVAELAEAARRHFGQVPPTSVMIQIELAKKRLETFAIKQAQRASQGWEIRYTESGSTLEDRVLVGRNKELTLIGRIDRIDYNRETGQWAIWDYKTSETAKDPKSVHWHRDDGWLDLQLPLYLPIARQVLGIDGPVTVGYIALPKRDEDIEFRVADFSQAELQDAFSKADDVATIVAQCKFWPENGAIETVKYDDYARICQTNAQFIQAEPPTRKVFRFDGYRTQRVTDEVVSEAAARLNRAPERASIKLGPLLIRASAGTGKTFQLSTRLLQILLSGQDVDSILATTFTRKAAGEILHRVLQRLARGCIDSEERDRLSANTSGVDTSAANCLVTLRRVTASIHRLRVSTLDSFFAQLASTFALDMGLPTGWMAMDPSIATGVQLQAITEMLRTHDSKKLLDLLHMLFKGETQRRVADEISTAVDAGYAVYRWTNEKAWDQLPLRSRISEAAVESALLAIESCRLNHKSADAGLVKLHQAASQGNWEDVVGHTINKNLKDEVPKYYSRELPNDLITALNNLADQAAAELLPIYRAQTLATYQMLHAYDQSYLELLQRRRQLAFSDISHFLSQWIDRQAFVERGETGLSQLEHRMDSRIGHLLLDEFQDTSPIQWNILRPLANPLGGKARGDQSFFCVGDSKQAIYGWRGGVAEILDDVERSIAGVECKNLRESFRSSPVVMEAVNDVFENLARHSKYGECELVASRWSQDFPKHTTDKKSLAGYVVLENGPRAEGDDVTADDRQGVLMQHVADRIAELTMRTSASIGVLFRRNEGIASMIGLLKERGIPASQDGGNPLIDSAAVELVLSLVHLADHPGDGTCGFHVRTSPLAASLLKIAGEHPSDLAVWFRKQVSRQGLGATIQWVAEQLADRLSWWDQQRLEQLVRSAHAFEEAGGGRLRDFEHLVEEQKIALPTDAQVKVMTIHGSKGLEFDAVFLPELDVPLVKATSTLVTRSSHPCEPPDGVLRYMSSSLQSLLPEDWQRAFRTIKETSLYESLCMLYVAMTRTRQALYMFTQPQGKEARQDLASLLHSTLAPDSVAVKEYAAEVYSKGDPKWFEEAPKTGNAMHSGRIPSARDAVGDVRQGLRSDAAAAAPPTVQIRFSSDPSNAPMRNLPTRAPSEAGESQTKTPLAGAFSASRSDEALLGKLIHAFFANIKWIEEFAVDVKALKQVAQVSLSPNELPHVRVDDAIDYFNNALGYPEVQMLLSRHRYQHEETGIASDAIHVDTERSISAVLDGRLVLGSIDRLVVTYLNGRPSAAEVIDYKTDKPAKSVDQAWLDQRARHHRPQLELYARVVSQQFGLPRDRVHMTLVLLVCGQCISL